MQDRKAWTRRHWLAWLSSLAGSSAWAQAQGGPSAASLPGNSLVFGMVPYLPVQQLVRLYEPIVGLFARKLHKPCRLGSATDFTQFIERARGGEFDLVGASPHVARILHREANFLPLVRATAPLEPLFIVPLASPIKQLKDLAGQSLLVADPFAVHVLIALRHLRDQGLVPGREVKLLIAGTQRNGVQRMLKGDAAAAVGSASTLALLPHDLSSRFRVLAAAPKGLTPMAYLAHPRLRSQVGALTQSLLAFPQTAEGLAMFKETQHEGLSPLTAAELAGADPLVVEYYKQRADN
ncbi:PhnD/SsuA/transferrin family substrate-binding protein [Paucibacter sp. AS339]|uniref:phosphate/phosphite/phosphonate ABC transporter substrate-binding protein n=1 Tax=Paucibacter hankyongi TaxID=3133434 RepID=UPI0030B69583